MCDTVFTFGQRGGFYFECPSQWQFGALPDGLHALFKEKKVRKTYCTVLGAKESYFVVYEGYDGSQNISASGMPSQLTTWLFKRDASGDLERDISKLKVTLGPNNSSFFATDGTSSLWLNLPKPLEEALEQRRRPGGGWTAAPRLVALGAGENYLMFTDSGGGSWNVSNYRTLDASIDILKEKEGGISLIQNVTLNPYRLQNFVLVSVNGILLSDNPPPHATRGVESIKEAVEADVKREQQRKQEQELEELREKIRRIEQENAIREQTAALARLRAQQAQILRLQNQLAQAQAMSAMINGFGGLNMGLAGGLGGMGGMGGMDMSSFWQPIIDAASMPIW